jgi:hypothetical protein
MNLNYSILRKHNFAPQPFAPHCASELDYGGSSVRIDQFDWQGIVSHANNLARSTRSHRENHS